MSRRPALGANSFSPCACVLIVAQVEAVKATTSPTPVGWVRGQRQWFESFWLWVRNRLSERPRVGVKIALPYWVGITVWMLNEVDVVVVGSGSGVVWS